MCVSEGGAERVALGTHSSRKGERAKLGGRWPRELASVASARALPLGTSTHGSFSTVLESRCLKLSYPGELCLLSALPKASGEEPSWNLQAVACSQVIPLWCVSTCPYNKGDPSLPLLHLTIHLFTCTWGEASVCFQLSLDALGIAAWLVCFTVMWSSWASLWWVPDP